MIFHKLSNEFSPCIASILFHDIHPPVLCCSPDFGAAMASGGSWRLTPALIQSLLQLF